MAEIKGLVDLELTSDDPLEFIGELGRLKIALLDQEIMREIAASGAAGRGVQQLLTARRSFQDLLARLGVPAGAPAVSPAARPAPETPAVSPMVAPEGGALAARLNREAAKATGQPVRLPQRTTVREPVVVADEGQSARPQREPARAADEGLAARLKREAAAARAAGPPPGATAKMSLTERLQLAEVDVMDAQSRRPNKVVVGDDAAGAFAPGLLPPADSAPALTTRLPRQRQPTLNIEAVESIEKKAKEDGFLNTKEMLWLKRGRLHEQIRRLEETGADPKMLTMLKNELDKVVYLLDGGLEKVKAAGISAKQEKKAAEQQKVVKKQEALRVELTGLLDEINGGTEESDK